MNAQPPTAIAWTSRSSLLPALTLVAMAWMSSGHSALNAQGLPEPSLTLYGTVTNRTSTGNMRLTAGTLRWRFVPSDGSSPVVLTTRLTNINDQFCYRLILPCEGQIAMLTVSSNTLKLVTPPITYDRSQVTLDGTSASLAQPGLGNFTLSRSERGRITRIDLEVSLPSLDMDGGGLSDDWEMRHFGKIGINPDADPDRDGLTNLQEMKAGTDPNDVQSAFAFIEITLVPQGGVQVRWSSIVGKVYALQRSPEILTGYADIRTGIPGTPPVNSYIDGTAVGARTYFYRLRVQE